MSTRVFRLACLLILAAALASCGSLWLAAYRHQGGGYGPGQSPATPTLAP